MITLFCAGPAFDLPEASPYVTKTEIQLQLAGLAYRKQPAMPHLSPKGQLPWIEDDGQLIADSTFIRAHIEAKYGVDLDAGLTPVQRAQAWAIERMLENHFGWTAAHFRFFDKANFEKGPAHWLDWTPEDQREAAKADLLDKVAGNLAAVGVGRHTPEEIVTLAGKSLDALSALLGDQPFLMGDQPTAVDAFAYGVLANTLTPFFNSPVRDLALSHGNLVAYVERMMDWFYPGFSWDKPMKAAA